MSIEKHYYEVECKCGHTGSRKYYIPIKFAVVANEPKEAAAKARQIPRCKHHHKDCVLNLREIDYSEFIKILETNRNDPYFRCKSIQEQKQYPEILDRFVEDPHYYQNEDDYEEEEQKHQLFDGKTKIRNPKRFFRNNYIYEEAFSY